MLLASLSNTFVANTLEILRTGRDAKISSSLESFLAFLGLDALGVLKFESRWAGDTLALDTVLAELEMLSASFGDTGVD